FVWTQVISNGCSTKFVVVKK
ncbi:L,D-transpeptidase catalytic domain protein, partial [Vibrio parahaemolyticus V-223/04]